MLELQRDYFTIENISKTGIEGRLIGTRVDLNTTLCGGRFILNERILSSLRTIKALQELGARVVILAHNGRRNNPDYVSLERLLNDLDDDISGVNYVGDTFDYKTQGLNSVAISAIETLQSGQAFLLENIRYLGDETVQKSLEEHPQTPLVRKLIDDLGMYAYVLDAFSVAHRPHMSMLGFAELPNVAGLQMDKELVALLEVRRRFVDDNDSNVFVFGGIKISDYFGLIEKSLGERRVGKILTGGYLGNLCLLALGHKLGEETRKALEREKDEKGRSMLEYTRRLKQLIDQYPGKFVLPTDVAFIVDGERKEYAIGQIPEDISREHRCCDIGGHTIEQYQKIIRRAGLLYHKGPIGWYDRGIYSLGAIAIMSAFVDSSGYSIIGGGDTVSMLKQHNLDPRKIDNISLAGGALVKALAGEELPAVNVLRQSYANQEHRQLLGM